MSGRQAAIDRHPDFPWLSAGEPGPVEALMKRLGWLAGGERVESVEKGGEGNMNLTLRIRTNQRSLILKQARPWVEKYDHIEAPWDRSDFERRFYERAASIPEVARMMPAFYAGDAASHALLLEDCRGARDLSSVYTGETLDARELRDLAGYLRILHDRTRGAPDPLFANEQMRRLNFTHIYDLPMKGYPGMDLDQFEPGLSSAAAELRKDEKFAAGVAVAGERYLASGPCLLHGDYFPGSWLRTVEGVRVIDPEFCFCGDVEFDLGCAVAHLALANQPRTSPDLFLTTYAGSGSAVVLDSARMAAFAASEVMRRLIGIAQLPIPKSTGRRAALLRAARECMLSGKPGALW